ncbi:MAG: hypothetical protein EA384_09305 [Spirochaetaceae bacterium]|nr:MAG: hypothetical protein EA384_09305 [Spirochaetaceae bacterium]
MAIERVNRIDDCVAVRRVLVSVSNKTGLESFVQDLADVSPGVTFYSTGGTYAVLEPLVASLRRASLVPISDYTGQPEMRGGLVKTLDYRIYLGLLAETYNHDHQQDMRRLEAVSFDMTVVNLYPFQRTISSPDVDLEDARGNIDIGGPAMLRAAAKNFLRVLAVSDPQDYEPVCAHLRRNGGASSLQLRKELAQKAFRVTSEYDAAIAAYLECVQDNELHQPYAAGEGGA